MLVYKRITLLLTIAIDTVRIPFYVVDLLESLKSSNFDEINSTIFSKILEKNGGQNRMGL